MGKRTEIKPDFVGMAAINSFVSYVSSPRATMDASHFAAHIPIDKPDERVVKSGIEYELGKYINDVRAEQDYIVKAVIPRYKEYGVEPPSTALFVEYEKDYEDGKGMQTVLDVIEIPTYQSSHGFFGYKLTPTEAASDLEFGAFIPKETVLAKTASYGREGSYDFGLMGNVVFMSHPSVGDDGFVISESFAKRGTFTSVIKRVININKNTIPLNVNSANGKYQFLPNIGDKVRPDGLLCAVRSRNDFFSICDMNDNNLDELDVIFDIPTYVNVNSVVTDITVIKGSNKSEFSSVMTEQLDVYADMLLNYYTRLTNIYQQVMAEKKTLYGNVDNVRLSPSLHRLMTDCYVKLGAATNRKNTICYRKLPVDQYRIEVTVVSTIEQSLGFKISDVHG